MCMGSSSSPPPPPPLPPPAPPPPTVADPAVTAARQKDKQVAQLNAGRNATILTSPQGINDSLNPANTTKKTLLGY